LKENWEKIVLKIGDGNFITQNLVTGAIQGFNNIEIIDEINEFFEKNPSPNSNRAISQGIEKIKNKALFFKNQKENFSSFFESF
jgi:hypothetical protein